MLIQAVKGGENPGNELSSSCAEASQKTVCRLCQEDKLVISHKTGQQDVWDPTGVCVCVCVCVCVRGGGSQTISQRRKDRTFKCVYFCCLCV